LISARIAWRCWVLGLLLVWQGLALAAPQINWGEMLAQAQGKETREGLEIDLRQRWEATLVGSVQQTNDIPLDPEQIWSWPAERFSSMPYTKPVSLQAGERLISRMTVFSERLASDFSITVMMPRLDAVHVSYRYDNGPWITLSAGDRIAMDRWPLADRQPSFNLPLSPGQLDVVMQFAHRGVLDAPVLLQNNRAFLESRTTSIWTAGIFMGVNLVMALMGLLMALNFQKTGFLAVTAMSFIMALVLVSSSGLGGMFVQTSSNELNDLSKFIINSSWGALLPVVVAVALGIQAHSKRWWWASVLTTAVCLAVAVLLADYDLRDESPKTVGMVLLVVLVFVACLLIWAWIKNYSRNLGIALGLSLYPLGLFLLFAAYVGSLSTDASGKLASLLCTLASLALMRGLFLQHRMGRQVLARANISPLRDVLTGLLNREGMQAHLYKVRERLQQQQTCAVFIYISVLDTQAAMEEHGEQGFEMGMVQMAASLSTSVTGADGVGRISGHAFGISVLMPPDPALAIRVAQKILSRLMVLASHGAPMASTARMTLAWMPLHGFRIDTLERRCQMTMQTLDSGKRIGWVGGAQSHNEAAQLLRDATLAYSTPGELAELPPQGDAPSQDASSANLYERIHRIEREMLHGVDTRFLVEEADRMSRALNEAHSSQGSTQALPENSPPQKGFEPTELFPRPQKSWPG
jgi:GGDEF domain-containing protein